MILRTIDLARATGISVQQVRNYEAYGFLPGVERSINGYRLYMPVHLEALKTSRAMIGGYGWQRALSIMQAVHQQNWSTALSLMDSYHAELAQKRLQIEQTLEALRHFSADAEWSNRRKPLLRVGAAAQQVGVQVSAIHFWEQQGLLHPIREKESRYRLYDPRQMFRLQVVAFLRDMGYRFDIIHEVLNEMTEGRPEKAIAAVERRYEEITQASWRCIEATAAFWHYIKEFGGPTK